MKRIIIVLTIIAIFLTDLNVFASTIEYDGDGNASIGGSGGVAGGGGTTTNPSYTLQFSNMLKVSLVELNKDSDFSVVDSYVLINRVRSSDGTLYKSDGVTYKSAFNTAAEKFKSANCSYYDIDPNQSNKIIKKTLSCNTNNIVKNDLSYFYDSNPAIINDKKNYLTINEDIIEFETQCTRDSCTGFNENNNNSNLSYGTWFAIHNQSHANISLSNMLLPHLSKNDNKLFYWLLYPLINKNNGISKITGFDVSSVNELKEVIEKPTVEQKSILQRYRIIIEPIYYFKHQSTGDAKFATTKAMARNANYKINEFGGYYFITFAKNFYSSKQHGVINSPGHKNDFNSSALSGSDKYSGIGYMVISIISDDTVASCNKATQCCYDASGNYHYEYYTNNTNYKCEGNNGSTCTGNLVSCRPAVDCPDTVNRAKCEGNNGTLAVFHENDNLIDCALNENSNSGFDLVKTSDTYVTIGGTRKSYCQVSCKDDLDISYPTNRFGYAGQYFTLENYEPTVNIKRTCVTSKLDYAGFKQDLSQLENLILSSSGASRTQYFNTYNDVISKFNKCTKWIEDDSLNMNNLSMKFSYDNDTYKLFGSGKELVKKETDYIVNLEYWNNTTQPNNSYTNANSNMTTESLQIINNSLGDKINLTFITNTYIKRIEEKKFTFNVPTLYSMIPSGKVVSNKPSGSYELLLKNAVPISLSTKKGNYNYVIKVEGINSLNRANVNDTFNYRFTQNALKNYTCQYGVDNDIFSPPGICTSDNCTSNSSGTLNFFYRPVDMSNINPNNRSLGYNWKNYNEKEISNSCNSKECKVNESMKQTDADYQVLVNSDKDKFEFILTPGIMSDIRNYNVKETHSGGYSDWKMNCISGGLHYYCKSNLLTCLASSGTQNEGSEFDSCNLIFSSHNMSNFNPVYDSSELLKNRNILMKKLEGFK